MPDSWSFSPHLTRIRTKRLAPPTKWRRSDGSEPRDKNFECRNVQEVCARYSPPANPPGNLPSLPTPLTGLLSNAPPQAGTLSHPSQSQKPIIVFNRPWLTRFENFCLVPALS